MTKLIDCPVCKKKDQPVRNDAKVCSPYCRLKQWRLNQKEDDFVKISNDGTMEFLSDGRYETTTEFGSKQVKSIKDKECDDEN